MNRNYDVELDKEENIWDAVDMSKLEDPFGLKNVRILQNKTIKNQVIQLFLNYPPMLKINFHTTYYKYTEWFMRKVLVGMFFTTYLICVNCKYK